MKTYDCLVFGGLDAEIGVENDSFLGPVFSEYSIQGKMPITLLFNILCNYSLSKRLKLPSLGPSSFESLSFESAD